MNLQNTKARTLMKELKCTICGNIFSIHRRKGRNKAKGHKKHLWCFKCQQITIHKEV